MLGLGNTGKLNKRVKKKKLGAVVEPDPEQAPEKTTHPSASNWHIPSFYEMKTLFEVQTELVDALPRWNVTNYIPLNKNNKGYWTSTSRYETPDKRIVSMRWDPNHNLHLGNNGAPRWVENNYKRTSQRCRPIRTIEISSYNMGTFNICSTCSDNQSAAAADLPSIGQPVAGGIVFDTTANKIFIVSMQDMGMEIPDYTSDDLNIRWAFASECDNAATIGLETKGEGLQNTLNHIGGCSSTTQLPYVVYNMDVAVQEPEEPEEEEDEEPVTPPVFIPPSSQMNIPVTFHVVNRYVDVNGARQIYLPRVDAAYLQEVMTRVNEMALGTYQPKTTAGTPKGAIGPVINDPNHSEALPYGFEFSNYIPANVYKYHLYNFSNWQSDYSDSTKLKKRSNSFLTTSITPSNTDFAATDFTNAKNTINAAYTTATNNHTTAVAQQAALDGSESAELTAQVNKRVEDALAIKQMGGLLKHDGIIYYDLVKYYDRDKLNTRAKLYSSVPSKSNDDSFYAIRKELLSISDDSTVTMDEELNSLLAHSSAVPGINVWVLDTRSYINYFWNGVGFAPDWDYSGQCMMAINKDTTPGNFAAVLLHEFGHVFGLPHAFYGGNTWLLKYDTTPAFSIPAVNEQITPDDSEEITTTETKNVARYNTLSADEKTFIELFYKKIIPSYTRGLTHVDLIDDSKDFTSYARFKRKSFIKDGKTVYLKSIHNSDIYMDISIAGNNNLASLISTYGYNKLSDFFIRLSNAHYATQDVPFFWTGSHSDDNHQTYDLSNLNLSGGGKQLVINKTDGNGNLIVNVTGGSDSRAGRSRVPFCIPDANGNPTDDYDEFWMYNMNWLNPDFPAYPDDWPTDKVYDRYDDQGNDLCPCLYAKQYYTYNKITDGDNSYNNSFYPPSIEHDTQNNFAFGVIIPFLYNRKDAGTNYKVGTESNINGRSFFAKLNQSSHMADSKNGSYQNGRSNWYFSVYIRGKLFPNYYQHNQKFTPATINRGWGPYKMTCNSGFMPEFGFYGFTARTPLPTDYIITENIKSDKDGINLASFSDGSKDDFVADNLRQSLYGYQGRTMHIGLSIRSTAGSSDPNSDYYNPFKVDYSSFTSTEYYQEGLLPKLMSDQWTDTNDPNPLNNFVYKGQPITANFMRHTMWYSIRVNYPEWGEGRYVADGEFWKNHLMPSFTEFYHMSDDSRNVFSPDTIERIEDFFKHRLGKMGEIEDYTKLVGREKNNLLNNYDNYSANDVKTAVEKFTTGE